MWTVSITINANKSGTQYLAVKRSITVVCMIKTVKILCKKITKAFKSYVLIKQTGENAEIWIKNMTIL